MNTTNFFIGQWVFFEFQLAMIESMEDTRVTGVTTGYISGGSNDFSNVCFPLDVRGKIVSEKFESSYNELYKKFKHQHLNWPDIHHWYVAAWRDLMRLRADKDKIEQGFKKLRAFELEIHNAMTRLRDLTVQDVQLFRS